MTRFVVFSLLLFFAGCCSVQCAPRIIGGTNAEIELYPSMVQVEYYFGNGWSCSCGASVLNELFILSAAHCFHPLFIPSYSTETTRIRAGSANRNFGGVIVNIEKEFNHPSFLTPGNGWDGDINVVKLASFLSFGPTIQQGPIPGQNAVVPDNVSVMIAGWGLMGSGESAASVLQHAQVFTVNNEECRQRYISIPSEFTQVTPNMICVGLLDVGGRSACSGDSGSPMFWNNIVIGIVSWGYSDCGHPNYPAVYAAVPVYSDWIFNTVKQQQLRSM